MYAIAKAGIALVFGAAMSWATPVEAADLGGTSLKDDGWSAPGRSVAGPCYARADAGHAWAQAPSGKYDGNPDPEMSRESLDNGWFAEAGVGCGSGSRGLRAI